MKELRAHVINTIEQATNFEGSSIQKQLDEVRGNNTSVAVVADTPKQEVQQTVKQTPKANVVEDELDEEVPF